MESDDRLPLAPALATSLYAAIFPLYAGLTNFAERVYLSAQAHGVVGYLLTALFGLPAFMLLRRLFKPPPINCVLVGAGVAAAPFSFFTVFPFSPASEASIDNHVTVYAGLLTPWGYLYGLALLAQVSLFGAIGGAVFWLVAAGIPSLKHPPSAPPPARS